MRLIDAEKLRKDVLDMPNCYNGFSDTYDKSAIIGMIDEQSTVDPIKHGHWISCDNDNDAPYKCSVCGGIKPSKNGEWLDFCEVVWCKKPYCAMCGAKMDEVMEDERNI